MTFSGAFAKLSRRRILRIDGSDAPKFLQGLITNQMNKVDRGGPGILAAFLNAQGRILYDVFVYPENKPDQVIHPSFLIDCDEAAVDPLESHLRKYRLRSRVGLTRIDPGQTDVWQAWGDNAHHLWDSYVEAEPSKHVPPGSLILKDGFCSIGCKDPRHASLGVRFVLESGKQPKLPASFQHVDASEYDIQRILNGIPEGPSDFFPAQSLPLESNLDYMSGVDFRKGCYLGQELTIRTYHTGVTRKRIVPVQFYRDGEPTPKSISIDQSFSTEMPASQTDIVIAPDADAPSKPSPSHSRTAGVAGKFCSGIHNIGLALVRLEHVYSPGHDNIDAHAHLVAANGLRMRAFAPDWWPRAQSQ